MWKRDRCALFWWKIELIFIYNQSSEASENSKNCVNLRRNRIFQHHLPLYFERFRFVTFFSFSKLFRISSSIIPYKISWLGNRIKYFLKFWVHAGIPTLHKNSHWARQKLVVAVFAMYRRIRHVQWGIQKFKKKIDVSKRFTSLCIVSKNLFY